MRILNVRSPITKLLKFNKQQSLTCFMIYKMFQAKRYFVLGLKYYAALFIEVYYNPMDEVHPSK